MRVASRWVRRRFFIVPFKFAIICNIRDMAGGLYALLLPS